MENFPRVYKFDNLKYTLDYRAKKAINRPVLQEEFEKKAQFKGKYGRNYRKNKLFGHFWCKTHQIIGKKVKIVFDSI